MSKTGYNVALAICICATTQALTSVTADHNRQSPHYALQFSRPERSSYRAYIQRRLKINQPTNLAPALRAPGPPCVRPAPSGSLSPVSAAQSTFLLSLGMESSSQEVSCRAPLPLGLTPCGCGSVSAPEDAPRARKGTRGPAPLAEGQLASESCPADGDGRQPVGASIPFQHPTPSVGSPKDRTVFYVAQRHFRNLPVRLTNFILLP